MTILDVGSLRVSFALVALTLLILFYAVTYRTGKAAYAAWWCASLAMFLCGATAYLLAGTSHQVWANPLGNLLVAGGAGCVWAGSRSLRHLATPWWSLIVAPVVVGTMSALGDPAHDPWSGGGYFLASMWLQLGLAAVELWRLSRAASDAAVGRSYSSSVRALLVASGGVALFYFGRWISLLVAGSDSAPFTTVFGEHVTTLVTTTLLTTVSFSMSTLSEEQEKEVLREAATRDGLTGLLNRVEFLRLAAPAAREAGSEGGPSGSVIMADLDHFKQINDVHGHGAGDRAIEAFAESCRSAVRSTDLVARYGGEEFVMLLVGVDGHRAGQVTETIRHEMMRRSQHVGFDLPTVSFGIAELLPPVSVQETIARADMALYRAKAAGRDRTVHFTPDSV